MSEDELATVSQADAVASALVTMEKDGLDYGSYFPMDKLRELAGPVWSSEKKFHWFITALTGAMRNRGYWFTSENLDGAGYRVGQPVENAHYGERQSREAVTALERGITLLSATRLEGLTEAEKLRHQNILRQTQHQRLMLMRAAEVSEVVRKTKPGLLKEAIEIVSEEL